MVGLGKKVGSFFTFEVRPDANILTSLSDLSGERSIPGGRLFWLSMNY